MRRYAACESLTSTQYEFESLTSNYIFQLARSFFTLFLLWGASCLFCIRSKSGHYLLKLKKICEHFEPGYYGEMRILADVLYVWPVL